MSAVAASYRQVVSVKSEAELQYEAMRRTLAPIRYCIWAYLILWIFEGALRKWVAPGLSGPLGVIREPFVALALLLAFRARIFPSNGFVTLAGVLLVILMFIGVFLVEMPVRVLMAGVWAYFWPIPFIFLIPRVMEPRDVEKMAKFLVVLCIPMTFLMVAQFYSPAGSFLNAMVGQQEFVERGPGGEVIYGQVRPTATWSFPAVASLYFGLVGALLLAMMATKWDTWLMSWAYPAAIGALVISTAVSKSRTQVYVLILVAAIFVLLGGSALLKRWVKVIPLILLAVVIFAAVSTTQLYDRGARVLNERMVTARGHERFWDRIQYSLLPNQGQLDMTPPWGFGLGVGTNTGALLLTGRRQFLLAEAETPRVLMEFGIALGLVYLLFIRYGIMVLMGWRAWIAAKRGDLIPLAFFAATFHVVATGQWGTPTIQGLAVLGAGLCLAAAQVPRKPAAST